MTGGPKAAAPIKRKQPAVESEAPVEVPTKKLAVGNGSGRPPTTLTTKIDVPQPSLPSGTDDEACRMDARVILGFRAFRAERV